MNESGQEALEESAGDLGLVRSQDFHYGQKFCFENGLELPGITLRYETYGRLNAEKSNAVLVCHALSGDHHCAGVHSLGDRKPGWWDNLIGPGKAVDTNRFFVIGTNCLGGCQGSTGPGSANPETGKPYGMRFPQVSIADMVHAQALLMDNLGIQQLYAVIGGSMGGMQVLQWMVDYPERVARAMPMATTSCQGTQAIAFNAVGRQAIIQDPNWKNGDYHPGPGPVTGLAVARMMAHITYLSHRGLDRKFGRKMEDREQAGKEPLFAVESYLQYQGNSFIHRFDANTYLIFTRALDDYHLAQQRGGGDLVEAFRSVQARSLIVGFTSDWLFPPEQNRAIVHALLKAGKHASYAEIETDLGHDSFLVDSPRLYGLVRSFLDV